MAVSPLQLEDKLTEVSNLSREELTKKWVKIYKHPPPKGVKRGLLERAVSYHLQVKHFGGLKSETRKALLAIAKGNKPDDVTSTTSLKPGTRLVREWHGKPYQVDVTETGFEWEGEEYTSLSAIAKAITGTKWSGPRFFGL